MFIHLEATDWREFTMRERTNQRSGHECCCCVKGGKPCATEYLHDCIHILSLPHCALDVNGKRVNHGGEYGLQIPYNFLALKQIKANVQT